MDIRTKIAVLATSELLILACSMFVAWQAERKHQAELQRKLSAAEQQIREADARQASRKKELDAQLAEFATANARVKTPQQAIEALPGVLPLPKPIAMELAPAISSQARPSTQETANAPAAVMPVEDLKPLYDFALGCKACQAELTAAQGDLKDERAKTATLRRERDSALQAARGGSAMKRVLRAAKWIAIGAAAGALAAKMTH